MYLKNLKFYRFLSKTSVHFEPGAVWPLGLFCKCGVDGHIVYNRVVVEYFFMSTSTRTEKYSQVWVRV